MSIPFRLAIVGVDHPHGAHWRQLLGQFPDEIRVVALVPAFGGGSASLEERFAHLPRYESVADLLLHTPFDGALVCLPNSEGPAAIEQLARAGKHVLAEKPVAASAEALQSALAAVRDSQIAFQNGYMWRYDEGANRLRRMVLEGQFGKLISIEMTYVTSDVNRRGPEHYLFDADASGGGFFNWLGCHYLDLLRYLTGRGIVGVTARVGVFGDVPCEVEDGGAAILELDGGTLATLVGGYWLPRWAGDSRWTVRGSQRWVNWDPSRPNTAGVLDIHGPQPQWHAMEEAFVIPADTTPGYGGRRGVELVADWLQAARTGRRCRNSIESTYATLQLQDAIYQSSRLGARVACQIPPL